MGSTSSKSQPSPANPVRMGMVGGGEGAFIGEVHRWASRLDGEIELVCGAFSRDADNTARTGQLLGLDASRCYSDFETMMSAEAALPESERMEFVAIVTPNHVHFPVAKAALEAGFHVLSDKPATLNLDEAKALREIVAKNPKLAYGLTHTYLGYPLVNEARAIVEAGGIGKVRKVFVEYIQGWLAKEVDNKQADWRTDPARSGGSGCMGDIGTHAHMGSKAHSLLVRFALEMKIVCRFVFTAKPVVWNGVRKSQIR